MSTVVMCSCGHAHQDVPSERMAACGAPLHWYILRFEESAPPGEPVDGCREGDYLLYEQAGTDLCAFAPAAALPGPEPLHRAVRDGCRLMLWSAAAAMWFPVAVRPLTYNHSSL